MKRADYGSNIVQGSLFSNDFIQETITREADWSFLDDAGLEALRRDLRVIFDRFPTGQTPNESQTEDDLIWPILNRLGWIATLRQQNLAARGREDVPDGLLFQDNAAKAHDFNKAGNAAISLSYGYGKSRTRAAI